VAPTIAGPSTSNAANGRRKSATGYRRIAEGIVTIAAAKMLEASKAAPLKCDWTTMNDPSTPAVNSQIKTYTLIIEPRMFVRSAGHFL